MCNCCKLRKFISIIFIYANLKYPKYHLTTIPRRVVLTMRWDGKGNDSEASAA